MQAISLHSKFAKIHAPLYFHPLIEGAHAGLKLVDEILQIVDHELYVHLSTHGLKAEMFALPRILPFTIHLSIYQSICLL